jgi:hypothetical protein
MEATVRTTNYHMHDMLNYLNISHYFTDYGKCWNAALTDVEPWMMAVLQQQY